MKNIIIMASTLKITKFFMRIEPRLNQLGFRAVFYTLEFSAYCYAKRRNREIYIPHNVNIHDNICNIQDIDFGKNIDVLSRKMSLSEASDLYTKTYQIISDIYKTKQKI